MSLRIKALCAAVVAFMPAVTASAQRMSMQQSGARDCAVCHLRWVREFTEPAVEQPPLLMDRPAESLVAKSATCLGCHDGSVIDARKRVWLAHEHATGIKPPPDMHVPDILPLTDGKIDCRTCHTAHATGGAESLATAVFLRVPNDESQLCALCHADKTKGPGLGTHPVGGMPWPVPETLIKAGARVGRDRYRLICQTCHTPHGAPEDHLLVMGTESSQLCLTCHKKLRPGMWRPETGLAHPLNPPLETDAQREAIHDMGTKTGPNDTLICLSCHKLHHGLAGRDMLADTLHDSHLCLRCHPQRAEMIHSPHDLRVSAPSERNRMGQTPEQSGPCGACHTFHQFARRPRPEPQDPTGLCATCHSSGQCAGDKTGLPLSHPTRPDTVSRTNVDHLNLYPSTQNASQKVLACLTCHNPHDTKHEHFLRADHDALCADCHTQYASGLHGPHDFTNHPTLKNAHGQTAAQAGKCGFCHAVHDAVGPVMWVATNEAPKTPEQLCTNCHQAGGLSGVLHATPLLHPLDIRSEAKAAGLPLFAANGERTEDGMMACGTCHNPHADPAVAKDLLRTVERAHPNTLCMRCHKDTTNITASIHSTRFMEHYAAADGVCGPCHAVHARSGTTQKSMWIAPKGPSLGMPGAETCTGCHSRDGGAPAITPTIHPPVPMQNVVPAGAPGYMPLADANGVLGDAGTLTCRTCHLQHGRLVGADLPAVDADKFSPQQLRARRPMIRPYAAPNLCSNCHGFDGLPRYLYYHDPEKRRAFSRVPDERVPTAPVADSGINEESP